MPLIKGYHVALPPPPVSVPPPVPGTGRMAAILGFRGTTRLQALRQVIASLRKQTLAPVIYLVEQDESPLCRDQVEPLVDHYLFTYSRELYNRSWAFNCGAVLAREEYLLLHDGDLIASPEYCEHSYSGLKAAPEKEAAYLGWSRIDYLDPESSERYPGDPSRYLSYFLNTQVVGGSILIARDFYLALGGMDERFQGWGGEDNAFYDKVIKMGSFLRAPNGAPRLEHYYHPTDHRHHDHAARNHALVLEYRHATTPERMSQLIQRQPAIGNPDRERPREAASCDTRTVLMIYDVEGWYYYHHAHALRRFAPSSWQVRIERDYDPRRDRNIDVIYVLDKEKAAAIRGRIPAGSATLLVGFYSVHWDWHEHFIRPYLDTCDHVVVMNRETQRHFPTPEKTCLIPCGVDRTIFTRAWSPWGTRPRRVLWCGSWAAHVDKGSLLMEEIAPSLRDEGISVEINTVNSFHAPRTLDQMAEWYKTGSVYVVASRSEGGPQPILEAASSGLAIVSTRVGIAPDLIEDRINGVLVDRSAVALREGIRYALENGEGLTAAMEDRIEGWTWFVRAEETFSLFDRLIITNSLMGKKP